MHIRLCNVVIAIFIVIVINPLTTTPLGYNATEQWRCIFAQYTIPHIGTPLFVTEGRYDSWQLNNILELNCSHNGKPIDSSSCSRDQLAAFQAYGAALSGNITEAIKVRTRATSLFRGVC